MEGYELEYGEVKLEGKNNDQNIVGSHHLIVELIKAVTELDAQNMILTSFEAKITFAQNPDVERIELTSLGEQDGVEVSIDTSQLERLQKFKTIENPDKQKLLMYIDHYAEEVGWFHTTKFDDFTRGLLQLLYKVWSRKIIMSIIDGQFDPDFDKNTVEHDAAQLSYVEINDLFKILDIKYKIRKVGGKQYKVDRI